MATKPDYAEKFETFRGRTLYERLSDDQRAFLEDVAFEHKLTFQEFRRVAEVARDLALWGEAALEGWWRTESRTAAATRLSGPERKKHILRRLDEHVSVLRRSPKRYPAGGSGVAPARVRKPVVTRSSDKKIWGECPVASEKTVCCNLRTIDAVENCVFGCSYCSVQTFYTGEAVFDSEFAAKLQSIDLDPDRFYHFGTGQSSDSLAWGNKKRVLDALCGFAADHPNVLLELKTKSDNVRYFLQNPAPDNLVCSWSLNTPPVIENEEHFTASLDDRIAAARAVADRGVGVAFHFHPMVYYEGWDKEYPAVAAEVIRRFKPDEVRFVSFGSVTLIKPVIQRIRELGNPTKILQMELVGDPHGKMTYSDDVKIRMFKKMYRSFFPWRDRVFFYLCMEKRSIWEGSFGYVYDSNEEFESEFIRRTISPRR
jgi:spore photoproduct lyase